MFKKIKELICKIFHIKACQCTDEPVVVKEEDSNEESNRDLVGTGSDLGLDKEESTVNHCGSHLRFRKNCPDCLRVIALI